MTAIVDSLIDDGGFLMRPARVLNPETLNAFHINPPSLRPAEEKRPDAWQVQTNGQTQAVRIKHQGGFWSFIH